VLIDLWQALSEGSGKDVGAIMHKWTSAVGYPVVTVEETSELGTNFSSLSTEINGRAILTLYRENNNMNSISLALELVYY
jgi:aminopeptidase N